MQTRRPARKSYWEHGLWYVAAALPVGLGILLGSLLIFAGMLLMTDVPDFVVHLMAALSLFAASGGMSRFAAFYRRRKGIQTGLVCSGFLWLLLGIIRLLWLHQMGGWLGVVCLAVGGVVGGVSGVNAIHRKPPR